VHSYGAPIETADFVVFPVFHPGHWNLLCITRDGGPLTPLFTKSDAEMHVAQNYIMRVFEEGKRTQAHRDLLAKAPTYWSCHRCTLLNRLTHKACSVCRAVKPDLLQPTDPASSAAGVSVDAPATTVSLASAAGAHRPPPVDVTDVSAPPAPSRDASGGDDQVADVLAALREAIWAKQTDPRSRIANFNANVACRNHARGQHCKYDPACRFSHDEAVCAAARAQWASTPCRQFASRGSCDRGDECYYVHRASKPSAPKRVTFAPRAHTPVEQNPLAHLLTWLGTSSTQPAAAQSRFVSEKVPTMQPNVVAQQLATLLGLKHTKDAGLLKCSSCAASLEHKHFSKSQRSRQASRKCRSCVESSATTEPSLVIQQLIALLGGATAPTNAGQLKCSSCAASLGRQSFSNKQLSKDSNRKCKTCISSLSVATTAAPSPVVQQLVALLDGATSANNAFLKCSSCAASLSRERFSKNQFSKDAFRKCKTCVTSAAAADAQPSSVVQQLAALFGGVAANSNPTTAPAASTGPSCCSACQVALTGENCSNNQRRKAAPKCRSCVSATQPALKAPSGSHLSSSNLASQLLALLQPASSQESLFGVHPNSVRQRCRDFHVRGNCSRGSLCRFQH
jgi:hypothetical protein